MKIKFRATEKIMAVIYFILLIFFTPYVFAGEGGLPAGLDNLSAIHTPEADWVMEAVTAQTTSGIGERPVENIPYPKTVTDTYYFPVRPGMPKWKSFVNSKEMIKACQIPDNILGKMSTSGLIETVLNYPLYMVTLLASDSIQNGFNIMTAEFNGLQELLKRKDVGAELLAIYHDLNPVGSKAGDNPGTDGRLHFYFYSVEVLLAQDAVRATLTETQRLELRRELLEKYESKKNAGGYTGWIAREVMILNGVTPQDDLRVSSTVVYTPNGSTVPALQMEPQDEMSDVRQCNIDFIMAYPEATWEADCTRMYNCHSYAWHSQATSNTIWINDPSLYWLDGSYYSSCSTCTASSGMKIYYNSANAYRIHSAVLISDKILSRFSMESYCRSKWGSGPLMYHKCGYVPSSYDLTDIHVYGRNPLLLPPLGNNR